MTYLPGVESYNETGADFSASPVARYWSFTVWPTWCRGRFRLTRIDRAPVTIRCGVIYAESRPALVGWRLEWGPLGL